MRLELNRGGITLIEVILTIVILAIISSGLSAAIIQGTQGGIHAQVMTTASFLAQERMEEQAALRRAGGYSALPTGVSTESPVPGYPNYDRTAEICYWDPTAEAKTSPCNNGGTDTGYKIITAAVQYTAVLPYAVPDTVLETLTADY